jgi:hypothetical protein
MRGDLASAWDSFFSASKARRKSSVRKAVLDTSPTERKETTAPVLEGDWPQVVSARIQRGKKWPVAPDRERINVTSGAAGQGQTLSPMRIGPVTVDVKWHDGTIRTVKFNVFENWWQVLKVPSEYWDSNTGCPTPGWYEKVLDVAKHTEGHRHIWKSTDLVGAWHQGRLQ